MALGQLCVTSTEGKMWEHGKMWGKCGKIMWENNVEKGVSISRRSQWSWWVMQLSCGMEQEDFVVLW